MRWAKAACGLALGMLAGCSGDDSSPNAAVQTEEGGSAVSTLMLQVSVRARSIDTTVDGMYLDYHHINQLRITVDGRQWGVFAVDQEAPSAAQAGWTLGQEKSNAIALVELGSQTDPAPTTLDTVREWVDLLDKYLSPGGHVAVIQELVLVRGDGTLVAIPERIVIPFQTLQGDATAYLGEVVADIDVEGGAQ